MIHSLTKIQKKKKNLVRNGQYQIKFHFSVSLIPVPSETLFRFTTSKVCCLQLILIAQGDKTNNPPCLSAHSLSTRSGLQSLLYPPLDINISPHTISGHGVCILCCFTLVTCWLAFYKSSCKCLTPQNSHPCTRLLTTSLFILSILTHILLHRTCVIR